MAQTIGDDTMAENNFSNVITPLFEGLDGFASAKTVVGESIQVGDTTLVPLMDISVGVGAGAALNNEKKRETGGGGMGARMSPSAVLVIQGGEVRLVNIRNEDRLVRLIDMAPDLIRRFTGKDKLDPEAQKVVDDLKEEAETGTSGSKSQKKD